MNLKLTLAALLIAPLALTACAKKDEAAKNETAETVVVEEKITPEQQAAIDSIDQPVLDEKNTDIPAEIANVDVDEATAAVEDVASEPTAQ
ncbi:hypothetical protein B9T25_12605 [Acinetobacter sp. ANC 4470]|uniref:hypothetical protein n=1 Tax=Acinetobacter sp. ANC 4470 TaxID=1977881 RepID=UPI000A338117|nr:hypothetical protein [Acinetobacter sp. ANC 4470]OTG64916.1 hypothetical protein B9T25_12605 [Acinetobacter sp. ANC 4470]